MNVTYVATWSVVATEMSCYNVSLLTILDSYDDLQYILFTGKLVIAVNATTFSDCGKVSKEVFINPGDV